MRYFGLVRWLWLAGMLGGLVTLASAQVPPSIGAITGEEDMRPAPPKRELRAFWIATVGNIDWPNQRGEAPEHYRREYRRLLDAGQRAGLNAVFVQIRPVSDAFYKSSLEPWSKYLTGRQGKAPLGDDDPLPFLIAEAHRHGMEFHAWFNPYRAIMDSVTRTLAPLHPLRRHPEWFIRYANQYLYNPGLPAVRAHIQRVILDVVRRYDLDGVHFDDYFYPYPEPGQVLHDEAAYRAYNPDSLKLADWRRQNVNVLIHDLHDSIRAAKRWVKFGISPFGVWMNKSADPLGSDTRAGQPSYSNLYADSRLWLQQGWIDYIVPQLYWSTKFRLVPYGTLLEWWTRNHFDRHLYIGQGTYRMFESTRSDTAWRNPGELPRQLRLNRQYPHDVQGSVFFSAKSLMGNPLHTTDSLRLDLYRAPALVPTMPWLDSLAPRPVRQLVLARSPGLSTLTWVPDPLPAADGDRPAYYVLYRFERGQVMSGTDPRRILALVRPATLGEPGAYVDTTARPGTAYAYYLTAVDRLHNESTPVRVFTEGRLPVETLVGASPVPVVAAATTRRPPVASVAPAPRRAVGRAPPSARETPAARLFCAAVWAEVATTEHLWVFSASAMTSPPPARLLSLDVFRGLTVMGMVLVNNPGDWGHIYWPLEHAEWHGCTPADLIFPFFLFIVGVSLGYGLAAAKSRGGPWGPVLRQVARRAAVLVALGLLMSLYPKFNFAAVRIPGILQRIGLVYLGASIVYLRTSWRTQAALVLALLGGYAALLQLVPVPGFGPANLEPATNLGAWLDRQLLGEAHLWIFSRTWDPEGLLGTLPALATGLLGVLAAQWLRRPGSLRARLGGLLGAGALAVALGLLWSRWLPVNKALWTSSYVLLTGGLAALVLAGLYWLCDARGVRRGMALPVAFGSNAVAVFFFSAILSRTFALAQLPGPAGAPVGFKEWLYGWGIAPFFHDPRSASLAGAVVCLLVWAAVLSFLYRSPLGLESVRSRPSLRPSGAPHPLAPSPKKRGN